MSLITGVLADFALAWRLLTTIPLPFLPAAADRPAGLAAAYYPLVGLILGLVLAGAGQFFFFFPAARPGGGAAAGAVGRADRPAAPRRLYG